MNSTELQAEVLYSQLETELKSALAGVPKLAIVGIYSGGAWLAERLAKALNVARDRFYRCIVLSR
jgi:pyrimidine operon attenuation protein / uracil phosphoribosyltransferase